MLTKHPLEVRRDTSAVVVQLAPRDPNDSPSPGLRNAVTGAIALECNRGRMFRAPVELDHQARRAWGL
jgi:hypothetical protein